MNILARKLLNTYFWSLKLQDVLFMIQRKLKKKKVRARTHLKCLIKFVWRWQSLNTLVKLIPLLRYQVALSTVTGYMYMYLSHRHYRASRKPVDLLRRGNQLFFFYTLRKKSKQFSLLVVSISQKFKRNLRQKNKPYRVLKKMKFPAYFI